jgi:hypothetical protein
MSSPFRLLHQLKTYSNGELFDQCVAVVYDSDLKSAARLRQVSTCLREWLADVWFEAQKRRLIWVRSVTLDDEAGELDDAGGLAISDDGRSLKRVGELASRPTTGTMGSLLPTTGRFMFSVCIDHFGDGHVGPCGHVGVGVCNESGTYAWMLTRFEESLVVEGLSANESCMGTPTEEGWPDNVFTTIVEGMVMVEGSFPKWTVGTVVDVVVDHSDGSLAFGINGEAPRLVPDGFKFPLGAQLRPWVSEMYPNGVVRMPGSLN